MSTKRRRDCHITYILLSNTTPFSRLQDATEGLQFHYVQKGDATKPLMVFVHGFPEFWYSWRYQLQEFYKEYWVVALDMRGYGDSDKPEGVNNYDIKYLVEDIAQFVKELGEYDKELCECDEELGECDENLGECDIELVECDKEPGEFVKELGRDKFTLVAHDWGGIVAWRFVDTHAHMLNSYIIMDAPRIESWMNIAVSNMQQFRKYVFFFQMPFFPELFISMHDLVAFKRIFKKTISESSVEDEDIEAFKYTFSKPGALTAPINWYRANVLEQRIDNIKTKKDPGVPGLFLFGEKDDFLELAYLEEAKDVIKNLQTVVIEGGIHSVQQDKPEAVNKEPLFKSNATVPTTLVPHTHAVRLPKLNLPTFNGNLQQWMVFSNLFETTIHSNTSLSHVEKFQYLLSSLQGDALKVIQGIPISNDNYPIAWNLLQKRYHQVRRLVSLHLDKILDLPHISHGSLDSLRHFLANYSENSQALIALDYDITKETLLIASLLRKLDHETRKRFEDSRGTNSSHDAHQSTESPHGNHSGDTTPPIPFIGLTSQPKTTVLLATTLVQLTTPFGPPQIVRGVLDSAAQCSFITERCAQLLNVTRSHLAQDINGISLCHVNTKGMTKLNLSAINGTVLARSHPVTILDKITSDLPRTYIDPNIKQKLKNFVLADPTFDIPSPIDILIGADLFANALTGDRHTLGPNLPVAFGSIFGELLSQTNILKKTILGSRRSRPSLSGILRSPVNDTPQRSEVEWESEVSPGGELFYIKSNPVIETDRPPTHTPNVLEEAQSLTQSNIYSTRSKLSRLIRRRNSKRQQRNKNVSTAVQTHPEQSQGEPSIVRSAGSNKVTFQDCQEGEIREVTMSVDPRGSHNLGRRATYCETLLGLVISMFADESRIMVAGFIPNGEAIRYKSIKIGDWLRSIDGQEVVYSNIDSVLANITSPCKGVHQSELARQLIGAATDLTPLLQELPVGLLYLTQEGLTEGGPEDQGVIYCYPPSSSSPNTLAMARGCFTTLHHLLPDVALSSPISSTAILREQLTHIIYTPQGHEIMLLALPNNRCSVQEAIQISAGLVRYLEFNYQTLSRAFSDVDRHACLNHFFSLFFAHLVSAQLENVEAHQVSAHWEDLLPAAHWVPLPREAQGYLLSSHLSKTDLVDVHTFCRQQGLLHLGRSEAVRSMVLWREVYPSSCNRGLSDQSSMYLSTPVSPYSLPQGRWFLLIVGQTRVGMGRKKVGESVPATLVVVEQKNVPTMGVAVEHKVPAKCDGNPGPDVFYVEQAQEMLGYIKKIGIPSVASKWISVSARPQITTPECVPLGKTSPRRTDNLLGLARPTTPTKATVLTSGTGSPVNKKPPEVTSILKHRGSPLGYNASAISLQGSTSEDSASQAASVISDESAPILGRRAEREKPSRSTDQSDDSESDWETYRDQNGQKGSTYDLSDIKQALFTDVGGIIPAKLTAGEHNVLFHYVHLDLTEGILLCPPVDRTVASSGRLAEILNNFRHSCQVIHVLLRNTVHFKKLLAQDVAKCHLNKSLIAIKEHGVLFQCQGETSAKKTTPTFTYWVVGSHLNALEAQEIVDRKFMKAMFGQLVTDWLDPMSRREWELHLPTSDELFTYLDKWCQALEAMKPNDSRIAPTHKHISTKFRHCTQKHHALLHNDPTDESNNQDDSIPNRMSDDTSLDNTTDRPTFKHTFKRLPNLHNILVYPKLPDPKRIREEKPITNGSYPCVRFRFSLVYFSNSDNIDDCTGVD
uniref:Protein inturned n=1 Tax=Timema shepardi TaxID=629360 RepID=A0A7R9ALU3_TIMSH|nr:unnamed protein product [Timema shepardi]